MEVQYVNINSLDAIEKVTLQKVVEAGAFKVERMIKTPSKLLVQVKLMDTTGKRKKYSITLRAESPSAIFSASAVDWDLVRSVRKTFNDVEKEILHRYKQDTSYKKGYA